MTSKRLSFLLLSMLIAAGVQPGQAQVLYGSVVGLVEDPSGGSIAGADVSVINLATGQTKVTKSDESGRYQVADLQPGVYDVKLAASGFRTATSKEVNVTANTVSRVDLKLEVGAITEQVTVQETPPFSKRISPTPTAPLTPKMWLTCRFRDTGIIKA